MLKCSATIVCFLLIFIIPSLSLAQQSSSLHLKVSENKIQLRLKFKQDISQIKWIIKSGRNDKITKLSDKSSNAPDNFSYPPNQKGREIWFPIIDIALDLAYKAVVNFKDVSKSDSLCLNGNFWNDCTALQSQLTFNTHLEHWENQLYIQSETATIENFHLEKTVVLPANETLAELDITSLSDNWYGTIQAWGLSAVGDWQMLAEKVLPKAKNLQVHNVQITDLNLQIITESLSTTLNYLLKSQNKNPLSPTYGGLYLFYDQDADTYRRSDWMWSFGPSIKFLLDVAKLPQILESFSYETLLTSARLISEASLRYQVTDPQHPAYGLVLCRYDPRTDSPQGAEGFYSPADSYFLAGWGWMPYYRETGDTRFLEASVFMTEEIGRILTYDFLIEQDYLLKAEKWKNWTMDESGFGMKGAAEVYAYTHNIRHQVIGHQYIEGLLNYFERKDGLWDRTWHRNEADRADNGWPIAKDRGTPELIETKYSIRGLGWAMIGLLSSHELLPEDDRYLEKAIRLSDHLLQYQKEDGHWDFLFKENQYEQELSAKGSALWTLLFYQLYQHTQDERHLQAARKGLLWCINQRNMGNVAEAYGGIADVNRESGVVYRKWNKIICSYTMAWFGLALLEELKLQE